ncbi:MAG TPA: glycosyltransferase family 39 protein [Roseimicrobium sp.]|nr:glycosyltransferase family 39 protein [Roseimicrobium sp.]
MDGALKHNAGPARISPREWTGLAILIVLTALLRLPLTGMPLERDEGEYAYAGQLILQGIPPYQIASNMKFPGTYAAYAVIMAVFGESPSGIRLGLIAVNALTLAAVFFIGRRLLNPANALLSAGAFAVLSFSPFVMGPMGHAAHFVVLAATWGFLLLLRAADSGRRRDLLLAGIVLGCSYLMKQHGMFFGAAALAWLAWNRPAADSRSALLHRLVTLGFGLAIPFVVLCVVLAAAGVIEPFFYWTFSYAAAYATTVTPVKGVDMLVYAMKNITRMTHIPWLLAGAGLLLAILHRGASMVTRKTLILFTAASVVSIMPGFYFRTHYFLQLMPALALLIGFTGWTMQRWLDSKTSTARWRLVPMLAVAAVLLVLVVKLSGLLRGLPPDAASRFMYSEQPFVESVLAGQFIRENSAPDARVAVIGSEPQIYFYAKRHSASGVLYTYPMMEDHRFALPMQEQMIRDIETVKPEFVVFVNHRLSWLQLPTSPTLIFDWASKYIPANYRLVGILEPAPDGGTTQYWGPDALKHSPKPDQSMVIFHRNPPTTVPSVVK